MSDQPQAARYRIEDDKVYVTMPDGEEYVTELPKVSWEMVTPETAHTRLQALHEHPRKKRQGRIDGIVRSIRRGGWLLNGDTVKQGDDGLWEDGQHRYWSIYESGIAVPMLVVRGITKEAVLTVDGNITRSYGDHLRMQGVKGSDVMSPLVTRMWRWDVQRQSMATSRSVQPVTAELERYRRDHGDELVRALSISRMAGECWLTPTTLGTCEIILSRLSDTDAAKFLGQLITGAELKVTDPAYVLRRRLKKESESEQRNYETRRALVFLAWLAFRRGEQIDRLQLPAGGRVTNRNYPLPV